VVIFQDLNMDPSTPELKCSNKYCPNAPLVEKRHEAKRMNDAIWECQRNIEREILIKEVKANVSQDILRYILDNHFKTW